MHSCTLCPAVQPRPAGRWATDGQRSRAARAGPRNCWFDHFYTPTSLYLLGYSVQDVLGCARLVMNSEGSSAPLLMGEAPDLNASPARSQLRSHAQHLGTPPRVAPPGQVARSPGGTPMAVISPKQRSPVGRLGSLDAVRGMTVCLMIFVDNVGDWFPGVDHSPWDDITLADFVMPYFLFMVGCSMSLSFSKYNGSIARTCFTSIDPCVCFCLTSWRRPCEDSVTYKIIWRTVKLFIIGVATQGADLWGGGGFDMSNIRIPGILQRIAWVCLLCRPDAAVVHVPMRDLIPNSELFERMHDARRRPIVLSRS